MNSYSKNIDPKKVEELRTLAQPLQEWLLRNFDLEALIVIDAGHAEVYENQIRAELEIKD